MSDGLVVPAAPENLRRFGHTPITSDVFHICDRIKELDPNLYIYPLDPPQGGRHFSIVERGADNVDRLVMRVPALDGRIIEDLEYLLRVPFEQRFAEAERRADKLEAEAKEHELDKLYDEMGAPMLRQLEHDGFITHRGRSYAKRGVRPR